MMKKILIGIGVVVAVVIVALFAIPFFVPVDAFKPRISDAVRDATGRSLAINGEISLSLLPRVTLRVEDVAFENASWAGPEPMAELHVLDVRVDPFGLLSGELRIESFVLIEPIIRLSVARDGQQNWTFDQPSDNANRRPRPGTESAEGRPAISSITLGDVRIVDGHVIYDDLASKQHYGVADVNVSVSADSLESPLSVDGSLNWNGEDVGVFFIASRLGAFVGGGATKLEIDLDSRPVKVGFDGDFTNAPTPELNGDVSVVIPSLKGASAWAGYPIEAAEGAFGRLVLSGNVQSRGDVHNVVMDKLELDGIKATGRILADLSKPKPSFEGRLDAGVIDVTPYMPPPATEAAASSRPSAANPVAEDWSQEELDVSVLNEINADFAVAATQIVIREVQIGRSELVITVSNGVLNTDLKDLNLYGGNGRGRVVVDARGPIPGVRGEFSLADVAAEPLLTDAADFERLSGTASTDFSLTANGRSQAEMVRTLNGSGKVGFVDGAIKGINVAAMVRNISTAFTNLGGAAQKTDFAELSGTFVVTNGVLRNDDLKLTNPLIRVGGSGTANIPARTLDYRLMPRAVASLQGQGAEGGEQGIGVPVVIKGPWSDLSARPDLTGVIRDIATDPGKAAESAKGVLEGLKQGGGEATKSILEGLTGAARGSDNEGSREETAPDPSEALKKLFGN